MSASMQKTCTGEPQHESKKGWLWHCGILPLPIYLEESETCQHKTSVGKPKGSHRYKRQSSILSPSRTPKPAPMFASSTSFSTCRKQWGWCALKLFQLLGHPCMSTPQTPLPSCVLVPHLHTATTVLSELEWNTPPEQWEHKQKHFRCYGLHMGLVHTALLQHMTKQLYLEEYFSNHRQGKPARGHQAFMLLQLLSPPTTQRAWHVTGRLCWWASMQLCLAPWLQRDLAIDPLSEAKLSNFPPMLDFEFYTLSE